jgi:hypothetical protein
MTILPLRKDNPSSVNVPPLVRDRSLHFFVWTEPTFSFSFFFRDCSHSAGPRTKLVKGLHSYVRSTTKKSADLLLSDLAIWQPLSITGKNHHTHLTHSDSLLSRCDHGSVEGDTQRHMVCASANIKYLGTIGSSAGLGHV